MESSFVCPRSAFSTGKYCHKHVCCNPVFSALATAWTAQKCMHAKERRREFLPTEPVDTKGSHGEAEDIGERERGREQNDFKEGDASEQECKERTKMKDVRIERIGENR
jgi:hypothetical protein